ncbi:NADH dehydrogenase [ubiquinone] 1 alpha subcomplex subunit 5 [Leptopilina heterotoma]|uniref:NADH dehydrogenase [ubiquinone] 1 alpha subcomplex subunit 5 n=1 Tax=Leptopilina heterotoma TaxID=63436 RepID=UPI001CA96B86|nr:NADH dehydrogenase [ubiquinone] 1 alpha subcomplex subunit 5 [Leptopilina heterotoma]
MSNVLKKTTGLTGILVAQDPHRLLNILYGKILRALDKLPQDYAYRTTTEKLIRNRAAIVKDNSNVDSIENKIECGQVEELIIQAQNELVLARKMLEYKPWQPLIQQEPKNQWEWPPHK